MKKDIVIRAYDLGGYGDIAGALRVADYLARQGRKVGILPTSDGARKKLNTLASDYPQTVSLEDKDSLECDVLVDVAGHYKDCRVSFEVPVSHIFIEDMDNSRNRTGEVPLYIKTGFVKKGVSEEIQSCGISSNPLFYRPFSEDEIPARKNLDPLELVIKQLEQQAGCARKDPHTLWSGLKGVSRIGFAHFKSDPSLGSMLGHSYVQSVVKAAQNSSEKYAVCFFAPSQNTREELLYYLRNCLSREICCNFVTKDVVITHDNSFPTIVLLGATPQLETSKMFLSSTIPPLVTGDLSLSDALYFLIAKDGPGFFYDCPSWKVPTQQELQQIIAQHDSDTLTTFIGIDSNRVQGVFSDTKKRDEYHLHMKEAFIEEITRRFGAIKKDGEKILCGTPFLFQDAAGLVIDKLLTDSGFKQKVEQRREKLGLSPKRNNDYSTHMKATSIPITDFEKKAGIEPTVETKLVTYKDLKIEARAYRAQCGCCKQPMYFDESLDRIKASGLDRHLRPQESLGISIDCLEGKLDDDVKAVYYEMGFSFGEWLSLAVENKGKILVAYIDPEGLVWNEDKYTKKDFRFTEKVELNMEGKHSQTWIALNKFGDEVVQLFYGRSFKELPKQIQQTAGIYLPLEGCVWPVARGNFDYSYNIGAYYCNVRASRGVTVGAKKIP